MLIGYLFLSLGIVWIEKKYVTQSIKISLRKLTSSNWRRRFVQ